MADGIDHFRRFLCDLTMLCDAGADEAEIRIGAVARNVSEPETGKAQPFVSGYSNTMLPNFWDRSAIMRARLGI